MTSTIRRLISILKILMSGGHGLTKCSLRNFIKGPVPYDVVKNGAYNRMYVNNTFRYHNKLFGDPRIRIVRQNVFETDDARKPCRPDMYDEGILNDPRYSTPCFKNIYDDITSETNDIRKIPFPGELNLF